MTGPRPGGQPRPFTPAELDGATGLSPDEVVAGTRVARELEALAGQTAVTASAGFTDRVMDAIAAEPLPAPARAAGQALRRGSLAALLASLRDAWRVTTGPSFPMAARAQALALVLVVAVLATGSGLATAGALGFFNGDQAGPTPRVEPSSQTTSPEEPSSSLDTRTDAPPSPDASDSAEPSETPEATGGPDETSEAGTDDHGGSGGEDDRTARPTRTPDATDSGEHDDETDEPGETPRPSKTPKPSETPHDEESHD